MTGFIKKITAHFYTQSINALGPIVLDKNVFYVVVLPLYEYGSS